MSAAEVDLLSLFLDAAQRSDQRHWAKKLDGERLSREDAVQRVVNVLIEQLRSPLPENGPGVDFAIGLACFDDFFSTTTPTDDEIGIVVERARSDYYAYQALGFLSDITSELRPKIVKKWERQRRLGLFQPPQKPKGPSPYKFGRLYI
jgi:hypothetical protein